MVSLRLGKLTDLLEDTERGLPCPASLSRLSNEVSAWILPLWWSLRLIASIPMSSSVKWSDWFNHKANDLINYTHKVKPWSDFQAPLMKSLIVLWTRMLRGTLSWIVNLWCARSRWPRFCIQILLLRPYPKFMYHWLSLRLVEGTGSVYSQIAPEKPGLLNTQAFFFNWQNLLLFQWAGLDVVILVIFCYSVESALTQIPLILNIDSQLMEPNDRDPMYFAKEFAVVLVTNPSSPSPYPEHCVSIYRTTLLEEVTGALQKTYTLHGSVDTVTSKALL